MSTVTIGILLIVLVYFVCWATLTLYDFFERIT